MRTMFASSAFEFRRCICVSGISFLGAIRPLSFLINSVHMKTILFYSFLFALIAGCSTEQTTVSKTVNRIQPTIITEKVVHDSDDPAIWIHPEDPSQSLILGTDKDSDGALFVFDLSGNIVSDKVIRGLRRPNNVDLEYGFRLDSVTTTAIAALTEREAEAVRIFSVPEMKAIDGGGIKVFEGETDVDWRAPMGIALYKNPESGTVSMIVGRKSGPTDSTYLWQYELLPDGRGALSATLIRKFGAFTGGGEIEAIAVDNQLGHVYYCEEGVGVRKYHADPAKGNEELAFFGQSDFQEDAEGIALLETSDSTGLIIVSDQQAHAFNVYAREGSPDAPHSHKLLRKVYLSTTETDGCEVTHLHLGGQFEKGLFVAMSDDKTFQLYPASVFLEPEPSATSE